MAFFSRQKSINIKEDEDQRIKRLLAWDPPSELKVRFPYFRSGHDKTGSPVWIMKFGMWDIRSLVEEGGKLRQDFDDYLAQLLIRITQSPKFHPCPGKPSHHFMVLIDLNGYSATQIAHFRTLQVVLNMTKQFKIAIKKEKSLKKAFVVNSNSMFMALWKLAAPIMGDLVQFFELHGTNTAKWMPILLDMVDIEQLPSSLGGSRGQKPGRRTSVVLEALGNSIRRDSGSGTGSEGEANVNDRHRKFSGERRQSVLVKNSASRRDSGT